MKKVTQKAPMSDRKGTQKSKEESDAVSEKSVPLDMFETGST